MFRALLRSSSGGQIVLAQHLVSSLSLGDCSVHRLREDSSSFSFKKKKKEKKKKKKKERKNRLLP